MQYINKVISRIEKGNPIVLKFDYDEFSKKGDKAKAIGLIRDDGRWLVSLEFNNWKGSFDNISLNEYMEKTKDIK